MNSEDLRLFTVISQPFAENTYIASLVGRDDCIVVDPGTEPDKVLAKLATEQLVPAAILNTHGHSDHIAGNAALKEQWPDCPLVIGRGDEEKLSDAWKNLSAPFGLELISPPADRVVAEGDTIEAAGLLLEVLETPGHSRGHVVFLQKGQAPWTVFGGDVLFRGSIGRTDFEDGDFQQLVRSIHEKLFTLPADTVILSGHGPPTTVLEEKQSNPFVGIPAGYSG